jgi:prepilin-type N-terminal cleavage/methylation domain-containing protein
MLKLRYNKKGFTLVEIIVVLLILAIMAAMGIPSLMGFISDAENKTMLAEARAGYTAAQAVATEFEIKSGHTTSDYWSASDLAFYNNTSGGFAAKDKFTELIQPDLVFGNFGYIVDEGIVTKLVYWKGNSGAAGSPVVIFSKDSSGNLTVETVTSVSGDSIAKYVDYSAS